ncbi:MAG: XrtA/PEP-CTERM system histidine kinase PrsK [bacterium]
MNFYLLPPLISFLAFTILGVYVFFRNRHQRINLFFALGMGSLAIMEFGNLMSLFYLGTQAAIFWKRISLVGECLVPGTWLVFCTSFARKESWYRSKKWKKFIIGFGALSVFFASSVSSALFVFPGDSPIFLSLGGIGKGFYIFFLLSLVMIVVNLEHTIRQSKGEQRIKIRSLVLGLGGLFAFLIFSTSQTLLFSIVSFRMIPLVSTVFVICSGVIAFSVVRQKLMDVNLYMSRFVIYHSFTLFMVGVYLLLVGLVGQVIRSFNIIPGFPLEIIFLFVAILFFSGLVLSDRVRWNARMLINRHFYRSHYDYRNEWLKFAEGLSLKLDMADIVTTIVNMLKDSVGVSKASLWLREGNTGYFGLLDASSLAGKTRLNMHQKSLEVLVKKKEPLLIDSPHMRDFVLENTKVLEKFQAALLIPLVLGKEIVGVILLGKKATGEAFLKDDIDLLKSAAAQITSAVMNSKLSQELIKAKEMEVFHRFSSFLLHDLKNLVSNLSLVVQNADEHMNNPQFQKDSIDTIKRSVKKMDKIIARLSNKTTFGKPNFLETDLNEVISGVVSRMGQGISNGKNIKVDLKDIPRIFVDRDQIEKVIENFLLNALEATNNDGLIKMQTVAIDGKVIFSVSDNGHGISPEFLDNDLFQPFKSTKKKGLGIGLYQCKTIVEAHQGMIEVESKEGVGSTFRIIMPPQV